MKTKPPFRFKQFTVEQHVNQHKVGTDSVLLGAWVSGVFHCVLDIGTGTGILALMMAQKNQQAEIIAIEPDADQCHEARINFSNSPFQNRLTAIELSLQTFQSEKKFDLIICNPPYFENSTPNANEKKTKVRHTTELSVETLYRCAASHLSEVGCMYVIIPSDTEKNHLQQAALQHLFPKKIMRTKKDDGTIVRTLIQFSHTDDSCLFSEMIVKHSNNKYSAPYIALTRDFYWKDLEKEK
ncbi:MAG: methyltransferase [Crocinitomicaceae bacterium]|nr:methyltransferase [Crocinitomicaceae bacterium]MBK8924879.1 methyltransferase [Crocinitomicaceae bacterium]